MTAADRREELEAIGWRYLGNARLIDELLCAADAYAAALASEPRQPRPPAVRKAAAVHYSPGGLRRPACLSPHERSGLRWAMTGDPADVTCGHCLKKLTATAERTGRPS